MNLIFTTSTGKSKLGKKVPETTVAEFVLLGRLLADPGSTIAQDSQSTVSILSSKVFRATEK